MFKNYKNKAKRLILFLMRGTIFLIPCLGLVMTYQLWNWAVDEAKNNLQQEFNYRANRMERQITGRLKVYAQLLQSGRGLFLASEHISHAEFKVFVTSLEVQKNYPGIQGLGFSQVVPIAEKQKHIEAIQKEGFPNYKIYPDGSREHFYTSIIYLEPFEKRNLRAFGYDMYSEKVRREAMDKACDTNETVMSGKVKLVQEIDQDVQVGFLLYLPLYRKGADISTIEQRRKNLLGWVYAPFRTKDFIKGIFGVFEDIDLEIYDGHTISPDTAIFTSTIQPLLSKDSKFKSLRTIEFAGHYWTVHVHSHPKFEAKLDLERARFIAIIGIGGNFMLSLIIWLLATGRNRAVCLAKRMNHELLSSEARFRQLVEQVPLPLGFVNNQGKIEYINKRFEKLFGYTLKDMPTIDIYWLLMYPDKSYRAWVEKIWRKAVAEAIATGSDINKAEYMVTCKNGSVRFMEISGIVFSEGLLATFIDVTEQKLIEQRLKESEKQFRTTFEHAPIGIVNVGLDKRFLAVNQTFCDLLHYSREELLTMSVMDITQEQDRPAHALLIQQIVSGEKTAVCLEKQYLCKDGSLVWGSLSIRLSYDLNGTAEYFIATIENIEQRKKIQEEILATKNQLQATLDAIPDLLFEIDLAGNYYDFHAHRIDLLAALAEQIIGNCISKVMPADAVIVWHAALAEANQQGWSMGKEFKLELPQGIQWFELSVAKKAVLANQQPHFMVLSRDITKRKLSEEILGFHSTILQNLAEGIMLVRASDTTIVFTNPQFERMFGYDSGELLGKPVSILNAFNEKSPEEIADAIIAELNQNGIWINELLNVRKDGITFWCHASVSAFEHSQFGLVWVSVHTDITERKLTEQAMQEAKLAAIAANQAKSEFLANMSHEIRTPMNAILGFSDILSDLITDKMHLYYLRAIKTSGKTLLQLINDILDLSKIEAGKLELVYQPVKIKAIFDDIAVIFMQIISEKCLNFSLVISDDMPEFLLLDEVRLRQVLLNIVGNAVKFTNQGFIRIRVFVKPTVSTHHVDLQIAISDTGIGISSDQLEMIFSPFTQQKQQNATFGGTGLGLTICKRLIEMMNGTISVESLPGKGSCFGIELPQLEICSQPELFADKKSQCSNVTALKFYPATILVVDDIELNRTLIKSYLHEYPNLKLIEAGTGNQALDLASQYHFDLVLMDKRLPDANGDDICEKIKALPGYADIPIIMITATVTPISKTQGYNLQLNKPVKKTELLNALQSFLHLDESIKLTPLPLLETVASPVEETTTPEELQELMALLTKNYQSQIELLNYSKGLQIDSIIEMADELILLGKQYHCKPLYEWASSLKSQAELFDLINLPKTLSGFNELITQLDSDLEVGMEEL